MIANRFLYDNQQLFRKVTANIQNLHTSLVSDICRDVTKCTTNTRFIACPMAKRRFLSFYIWVYMCFLMLDFVKWLKSLIFVR